MSKSKTLAEMSEVLHLTILLQRPRQEVVETASALLGLAKQTVALSMSSRADQRGRMALMLAQRLAEDVHRALKAWAEESAAETVAIA